MRFAFAVLLGLVFALVFTPALADSLPTVGFNGVLFQDGQCGPYCGWQGTTGTFQLFDAETGGTAVGLPMEVSVQSAGGYFHAELPIDPRILDSGAWIEVSLETVGTLKERTPLGAVPWASRVASLDGVVGPGPLDMGAAKITSTGNQVVGVGTFFATPGEPSHVRPGDTLIVGEQKETVVEVIDDTHLATSPAFAPQLDVASYYQVQRPVAMLQTSKGEPGLFVSSEGNVGIGSINPGGKLVVGVYQSAEFHPMPLVLQNSYYEAGSTAGLTGIEFGLGPSTGAMIKVGKEEAFDTGGHRDAYLSIWTNRDNATTEKIRVLSNGNVGIGTTQPEVALHVDSSGKSQSMRVSAASNGKWRAGLLAAENYEIGGVFTGYDDHWVISGDGLGNTRVFSGDSVEAMRITPSGNVGIGRTDPQAKLDVRAGNIRVTRDDSGANQGLVIVSAGTVGRPPCTYDIQGAITYDQDLGVNHGNFYGCRGKGGDQYEWVQLNP